MGLSISLISQWNHLDTSRYIQIHPDTSRYIQTLLTNVSHNPPFFQRSTRLFFRNQQFVQRESQWIAIIIISVYVCLETVAFKFFCGDRSPFCVATDALCFKLWLNLPMFFKARVDLSSSVLCSHLCIIILKVNSEFPGQDLVQNLLPGIVRLPLDWPSNKG